MTQSPTYPDYILKIIDEIENAASGVSSKPKITQRNYLKENCKHVKDIQEKAKQKSATKQPLQPIRAVNKYSQVEGKVSRVFNASCPKDKYMKTKEEFQLPRTAGPYRTQPPVSACLSSKSDNHRSLHHYKSLPQLNEISDTEKVSDYLNNSNYNKRKEENFMLPKSCLKVTCPKNKEKCETKSETKHRLGHIPSYLTARKKQWELEKERQLKLLEESSIPPGHTLLPDEERLETLELLKKNQDELLQSLASLPVRNDTLRLQHYKEDLERQLAKVEEGIKIFSRPKVLIKNDT